MAMVYMTHPQHGAEIAYTGDEVARLKKAGWTERATACEEERAPVITEAQRDTLHLKRRPGRPRKAA